MGDLALNTPEGKIPKKSGDKKPKTDGKDTQMEAEVKVQSERADAAEERIREMEDAPVLIVRLDEAELAIMVQQQATLQAAAGEANKAAQGLKDLQTVAIMLNSAYNAAWVALQKKHGLPEDVDVDWTTGEVFRKKVSTQVDNS